jgi:NADPH:quinone reductase-like Zn-dependent oxidoreductase
MRALVVWRYGPPKNMEVRQQADVQPKAGEVLVRVRVAGVNFADLLQRMGIYPAGPKPPFVPGGEVAGVIERFGDGAGAVYGEGDAAAEAVQLRVGDAVVALLPFGGYAEWVVAPAQQVYRIPAGMSFEDAAAIPVNYLTAYHSMFGVGNLEAGDRILIHNAAGGVGIAAVQLAKQKGLVIFGTAGPAKQEFLRKLHVDHPIDYERSNIVEAVRKFAPDGIEMVMDAVGGKSFADSYKCLGPTGRLVVYGFSAAAGNDGRRHWLRGLAALLQTPRFHPLKLLRDNISVCGVNLGLLQTHPAVMRRELEEIFRMYAAGEIKPVIAKKFLLDQGAEAHQFIHDRKNIGKVLLWVK